MATGWGSGVTPKTEAGRELDRFRQRTRPHPFLSSLPSRHRRVLHWTTCVKCVEDADEVICEKGHSTVDSDGSRYVFTHKTAVAPRCTIEIPSSSVLFIISSGSKRPLDSQEDAPEPKRRRTAGKRSRLASETDTSQSTSGASAPFDEESELVALRKTLQQVQEDLSSLQQDQRQLDEITRGLQHDRDEAQPRDTLRFLEEHFTCALWVLSYVFKVPITQQHTLTRPCQMFGDNVGSIGLSPQHLRSYSRTHPFQSTPCDNTSPELWPHLLRNLHGQAFLFSIP